MPEHSRRDFLAAGSALALDLLLPSPALSQPRIVLNDASRLNPTSVVRHWVARADTEAQFIEQLRAELKAASREGRPVALGCARHSMGGQSLAGGGTVITFDMQRCEADPARRSYRASAGTRWRHIVAALDPIGFSPAVMQSNNDFGIAGTLSVNAHGWPVPFGPFATTVRSFRVMLADGTILACSPTRNRELFRLVSGGYGLFGAIIDLELDMARNVLLAPTYEIIPAEQFATRFTRAITRGSGVQMAYGRLSVARDNFLHEALMVTYRPLPTPPDGLPRAGSGGVISALSREIFRAQVGSDTAKRARWLAETVLGPSMLGKATRNALLNEPVSSLQGRDQSRTDILHEYFVPRERLREFLAACRDIILRSEQDLLNVTLRYVAADAVSRLAYAPGPRIAAVMLFSQAMTAGAERDMRRTTEALIDRVLELGGSFYLPYRLHARRDQVEKAYPMLASFLERKRHYDPYLLFRNTMWDSYFARPR